MPTQFLASNTEYWVQFNLHAQGKGANPRHFLGFFYPFPTV